MGRFCVILRGTKRGKYQKCTMMQRLDIKVGEDAKPDMKTDSSGSRSSCNITMKGNGLLKTTQN